jgi:hypothetical protein
MNSFSSGARQRRVVKHQEADQLLAGTDGPEPRLRREIRLRDRYRIGRDLCAGVAGIELAYRPYRVFRHFFELDTVRHGVLSQRLI